MTNHILNILNGLNGVNSIVFRNFEALIDESQKDVFLNLRVKNLASDTPVYNINNNLTINVLVTDLDDTEFRLYSFSLDNNLTWLLDIKKIDNQGENTGYRKLRWNKHDFYEMVYVYQGRLMLYIENNMIINEPGDYCIVDKNVSHYEEIGKGSILIFFCISEQLWNSFIELSGYFRNSDYKFLKFASRNQNSRIDIDVIVKVMLELHYKEVGYEQITKIYLERIFRYLLDHEKFIVEQTSSQLNHELQLYHKIITLIINKGFRISKELMSNELHFNGDYLCKIIKKQSGVTFTELKAAIWIESAKAYLSESDLSIDKIIELLGFENKTYFYKKFHQNTNYTPAQYREIMKNFNKSD